MTRTWLLMVLFGCGGSVGAPEDEATAPNSGGAEDEATAPTGERSTEATDRTPLSPPLAAVLAAHDRARAEHCAPPLEWSPELAAAAERWANELAARGCALAHSDSALGENLYAATAGSSTGEDAVRAWVRERNDYDFDRGGFSMATGHFTQVVWKSTERLGCATRECGGLDLWVCNYDPAGNVRGAYPANVSPGDCGD